MTPYRPLAVLAAVVVAVVTLTGCGTPSKPQNQPLPAGSPQDPGIPTIDRWVNQPCSPEGAKAKTRSGGNLVCQKVGSDKTPEWHAAD